ncbi:MAG: hypothetical protein JW896_03495 [Deltaproteobacteria bacterium]|nr:hypothetical protein [Deltaproteobacteria bacterium]
MQQESGNQDHKIEKPVSAERDALLRELNTLPGSKILDRLLEMENPRETVESLSSGDFYWLAKKIGDEDCVPLLELASTDQWQYLIDLEIWKRDRLDVTLSWDWMKRLQKADSGRLIKWLLSEGETFTYYHLFKSVELIVIENDDEVYTLPDGFFSLDGNIYIRVIDSDNRETIESIIRGISGQDFTRYQALLLGLGGLLPAETEEQMYRMKNVRLAEHGFFPHEEAISVYAPLEPENLGVRRERGLDDVMLDEEVRAMVPLSPLVRTEAKNILTEGIRMIADQAFLDRIRLEFAVLSNQLLAADGLLTPELDVLIRSCRKAARYLNLALERLGGRDLSRAEETLRNHSLVDLFRIGFGLALKVKWEAERWVKGSWFYDQDLDVEFWGEHWGGVLGGLLDRRPKFYVGDQEEEEYRDFEWLFELSECSEVLRRLMVLDGLMAHIVESYPLEKEWTESSEMTFKPLLFNLWGRLLLDLEPGLSGLSLEEAKSFFEMLRGENKKPPYVIDPFKERFINDFMSYTGDADPEAASVLKDTLTLIWQDFTKEYEWVWSHDLDSRFSTFVTIRMD